MLGAKAGKNMVYILSPLFLAGAKQGSFFLLLHYSITPILQIQLTSAFDKKADNCSLPTAVIYTRYSSFMVDSHPSFHIAMPSLATGYFRYFFASPFSSRLR